MFTNDMLEMATASMVDICKEKLKKVQPDSTEIQMGIFLATHDEDLEIMQYTGLKDKNGIEIYEGDITRDKSVVKIGDFSDWAITECYENVGILGVYEQTRSGDCWAMDTKRASNEITIVGNIFENLELLEVK